MIPILSKTMTLSSTNQSDRKLDSIVLNNLGKGITVSVRRSTKAKRFGIRIIALGAELILPKICNIDARYRFLLSKESWIRLKLDQVSKIDEAKIDQDTIPFFGRPHKILYIDSGKRTGRLRAR